jgi:predicted DNA-binding ribbon-helix-helix protein
MGVSISPRTVIVAGRRTSFRLEESVWNALDDIAEHKGLTLKALVTEIANAQGLLNLSASIRVYVVEFYRGLTRQSHNRVLGIVQVGFVAFWRGQSVRSVDGALHLFPSARDAWMFLAICDDAEGMPAIRAGLPEGASSSLSFST